MIARASLVVERVGGRSRCTEVRSDPPLTLRETPTGVHLVASGAGPVGGDDLALSVRIGPGAELDLRSVAASMAHPGPSGRPSHLAVDVAGGRRRRAAVDAPTHDPGPGLRPPRHHPAPARRRRVGGVARGGGPRRHGEASGSILQRLLVDDPGGPVLRTDLALGPAWPGSLGPAGVGPARAVGRCWW